MGVRDPIGQSCRGCLGLQTFLRSKSEGKISNHFLKLLLQRSLECRSASHPRPRHCLTQPFMRLHSRIFLKIYVYFNKNSSQPAFPWWEESVCGSQAFLLRGEQCGWRLCRVSELAAAPRLLLSLSPSCLWKDFSCLKMLLARECQEEPRICRSQIGYNPGAPCTDDRALEKILDLPESQFPHL